MGSEYRKNIDSTGKCARGKDLEELVERRKSVVRIVNEGHGCMARAIAVGYTYW